MKPHIAKIGAEWAVIIEYEGAKLFTTCKSFSQAAHDAFMIGHIGRYKQESLNFGWHKTLDYSLLRFLEFRELPQ